MNMNGIPLMRLSGLNPDTPYKVIETRPLGNLNPCLHGMSELGSEFEGLGCACQQTLSGCNDNLKADQLFKEFEQRVKVHLINTYNYIVKNRQNCGMTNADNVALAYKKIIDSWADPRAREAAMNEAERIIANDDKLALVTAAKIARDSNLRNMAVVKTNSGKLVKMKARRRVSVSGLGEADIEILPTGTTINGTPISLSGLSGLDNYEVSLGATLVEADPTELAGDDGSASEYVLTGIDGLGKKVAIKIKPKNAITKLKQSVNAVKKQVTPIVKKVAAAPKTSVKNVQKTVKKAVSNIKKYNPVNVAARNGFLLAVKLNIKNLAKKLKWGYATLEQAKRAGLSATDYQKSVRNLKAVESYWKSVGGDVNALRNAVLKSKAGSLNGLGVVAVAAAIAAATPIILAILKLLTDSKVKTDSGQIIDDPNGEQGPDLPTSQVQAPQSYNPSQPVTLDQSAVHEPYYSNQDILKASEGTYQNVSDSQVIDPTANGNQYYVNEAAGETTPPSGGDPPASNNKNSSMGPVILVAAIGLAIVAVAAPRSKKGLSGTDTDKETENTSTNNHVVYEMI